MGDWTTRVEPERTRSFGVGELHSVLFAPLGWPGRGPVVGLLIPECEMQFCAPANGGPVMMINRPVKNKNVRHWLRAACEMAIDFRACVSLACDTGAEAERWAKRAQKMLPGFYRVPLERMYHAATRAAADLN